MATVMGNLRCTDVYDAIRRRYTVVSRSKTEDGPFGGRREEAAMPVEIEPITSSYAFYRYRVPWCWWRLHELHLIAVGEKPDTLEVVDPTITQAKAQIAYQNALGCMMGEMLLADRTRFEQLVGSALEFAESQGLPGLEAPLLSGLLGIDRNASRQARSVAERISDVLGTNWSIPPAGGMPSFPVVDRSHGRVSFFEPGAVGSAVAAVAGWLNGPDAGFGGLGGFGYGFSDSTPAFNGFASRMGQLSADTGTAGVTDFCRAFGAFAGTLVTAVFAAAGAEVGGTFGGPPGAVIGGIIGAAIGEGIRAGKQLDENFAGACTQMTTPAAPIPTDTPSDDSDESGEEPGTATPDSMPNPTADDTGLQPTELEIARALATRDFNRTPDRNGNTFLAGEPVVIRSSGAAGDSTVTDPTDSKVTGVDWTYRKWVDPRTTIEATIKNGWAPATPSVLVAPDLAGVALVNVGAGSRAIEVRGVRLALMRPGRNREMTPGLGETGSNNGDRNRPGADVPKPTLQV
jgi:hypothetical protein